MVPNKKSHKIHSDRVCQPDSEPATGNAFQSRTFSNPFTRKSLLRARIKVTSCRLTAAEKELTKLLKCRRHHILFIPLSSFLFNTLPLSHSVSMYQYVSFCAYSFISLRSAFVLPFFFGQCLRLMAEIEIL